MPPSYLHTILELLLMYLASLQQSHDAASVLDMVCALEDEHEIRREVTTQVMQWFGDVSGGKWKMDVDGVVRQVGLGILRHHKVCFDVSSSPRRWTHPYSERTSRPMRTSSWQSGRPRSATRSLLECPFLSFRYVPLLHVLPS